MNELETFIDKQKFPGRLVFGKLWGSRSHNCERADSDWDFSGIYVADTREFLGMNPPSETMQNKEGVEKPDFSFHEAGKFCKLLLVGNPGILEMLFTERMCISTPAWEAIKEHRHKFLTKKSVMSYIGYAEGQLRRLKSGSGLHTKGGECSEKWMYHLTRLLMDATRIVVGGEPLVWYKDGPERKHLMRIRNGEVSKEEIQEEAQVRIDNILLNIKEDMIPETGDENILQKWLVDLRLKQL